MNTPVQKPYLRKALFVPWLVLILLLSFVGGFITLSLYQEHERIELRERDRLATQAKVVDENLARQLDVVYLALQRIRNDLPIWRKNGNMGLANHQLVTLIDTMPGIRTLLITDSKGTILATNRKQVLGYDIRNREYFSAPLKGRNPSTLYISPPFKTILGNFVINASLMIPGPDGGFGGVVSAGLDPGYFTTLLDSVRYAPDMWTALAHRDGKLFLRVPATEGVAGLDLNTSSSLFTRHIKSGLQATVFIGTVPPSGEKRMMAQRTSRPVGASTDKPLVVAVSRNLSALHADWRRDVLEKGVLFGVLVLAMTLALYFYQRRLRKFESVSADFVRKLYQAKDEALRANLAKSRFLATVAHEFRTPLSILTSSIDILDRYNERLNSGERAQQHDNIRNAARHMSGLIDSVLTINRLGAQSLLNDPVEVNVGEFCRILAEEVKTACCSGQKFCVTIAEDCGTVRLDEALFRRVVENLLTNAFRYTPADGTVSLHVNRENGRLQVVVADSGIGIPEECQQRVFETFYRGRNIDARQGLGLGLAIVHEALSHMGGTISLDSVAGEGTTMRVELPVAGQPGSEEQQLCTQS